VSQLLKALVYSQFYFAPDSPAGKKSIRIGIKTGNRIGELAMMVCRLIGAYPSTGGKEILPSF